MIKLIGIESFDFFSILKILIEQWETVLSDEYLKHSSILHLRSKIEPNSHDIIKPALDWGISKGYIFKHGRSYCLRHLEF